KELSEVNMIAFPASAGPNFADLTLGRFRRRGLKVNVIQQVNDLQTALSLVASEMGFTLVPEQERRLQREGVEYMPLADDNITAPVLISRRAGENPNAIMRLTNTILAELVENRITGRYP
ncbi:MAG: LysR family transcriptional regulator, partial [Gammaproteobacteria bacterium]|nr:LysR family transcriptional regulator [Gammaproteobacteria bacterium]